MTTRQEFSVDFSTQPEPLIDFDAGECWASALATTQAMNNKSGTRVFLTGGSLFLFRDDIEALPRLTIPLQGSPHSALWLQVMVSTVRE